MPFPNFPMNLGSGTSPYRLPIPLPRRSVFAEAGLSRHSVCAKADSSWGEGDMFWPPSSIFHPRSSRRLSASTLLLPLPFALRLLDFGWMTTRRVYLDHQATTPLLPEVWQVMQPFFTENFGSAASFHQ